jgi:SP family general alpha glucoside:H+ symporter-like MFS transporter
LTVLDVRPSLASPAVADRCPCLLTSPDKLVVLASLVVLTGFIALTFAATSRGMLLTGQILSGLPWGTLNTIAPSYAIETAPLALRHYTPTFVNLCWVIGHLIGAGVLDGMVSNTTEWGWRLPFALQVRKPAVTRRRAANPVQWMFPLPLFALIIFAPDSPWWLVRKGHQDAAVKSLDRLSDGSVDNTQVAALMKHTVELEAELNFGSSYWDCFRGVDLRRTEIACVIWVSQALVGFAMQGYNTSVISPIRYCQADKSRYFFTLAGLASSDAFKLTLGVYTLAFIGTSISMPLQTWFGRRTIWLSGMVAMFVPMLLIGILGCIPNQTSGIKWAQAVLLLVWFFMYGWSAGPLPYVVCSEIGSAKLRSKVNR